MERCTCTRERFMACLYNEYLMWLRIPGIIRLLKTIKGTDMLYRPGGELMETALFEDFCARRRTLSQNI